MPMSANATWMQWLAVAGGAAMGGVLRWRVGLWLNPVHGQGLMWGTLAVNAIGGLLVGVALASLARSTHSVAWLLLVTGFLGGLTTFSAFTAESLQLLQRQQWLLALGHTLAHVFAALGFAVLGYALVRAIGGRP